MDRGHLSRKCSTKSKGLNFNSVLSKEEYDDSDVENYESDAEYLEDYIVTKEGNEKGLGLMAIKCLKKYNFRIHERICDQIKIFTLKSSKFGRL